MEFRADTLFNGVLKCQQPRDGYRFSVDAVLLAHFTKPNSKDKMLDLGAGCGVISLILAYRHASICLTGLELQDSLVNAFQNNIDHNNLRQRISLCQADLRKIKNVLPAGSFDYVVCNPPYYKCGSGRKNCHGEQAIARHEIMATLDDTVKATAFALKNRGRAAFIYPAERAATLITMHSRYNLEPKRLQVIHAYPSGAGKMVLLESVRNGGEELQILPPFYIYREPDSREYTSAMAALYLAS